MKFVIHRGEGAPSCFPEGFDTSDLKDITTLTDTWRKYIDREGKVVDCATFWAQCLIGGLSIAEGKQVTTALQMQDEATSGAAVGALLDRRVMRTVECLRTVAALYVEPSGIYVGVPGVDLWDEARDARKYSGPHPVVCHSPCQRWGKFWHGSTRKPHQYRLGEDGGCFAAALTAVRNYGGVLEHPADSKAWAFFGLRQPKRGEGWVQADGYGCMTCYVEQGHYGHASRKPTWLLAKAENLPELNWTKGQQRLPEWMIERYGYEKARRIGVVAMVGGKNKTAIRNATPEPFRDLLLSIARQAHNTYPPTAPPTDLRVGDKVRTGVYVNGEWRPMQLGTIVAISADGQVADVDIMSLHGGRPWINQEQVSHLRKDPS